MSSAADPFRRAANAAARLAAAVALVGSSRATPRPSSSSTSRRASRMVMRLHLGDQRFLSIGYGEQSWSSIAERALARWNAVGGGRGGPRVLRGRPIPRRRQRCNRDDGINEVRFASSICGLGWGDAIGIARRRVVDGSTLQ